MQKGYCLNSLGKETFKFDRPMESMSKSSPQCVKRVHEIYVKPTFMKELSSGDVVQGRLGDCWFVSSLSALCNVEGAPQRNLVEYDTSQSTAVQWAGW